MLALQAPRRPTTADCDSCRKCLGGSCESWRKLQREWVQAWQGQPPPEGEGSWATWWKERKTAHKEMLAAAHASAEPDDAAVAQKVAAAKRSADAETTPNAGGQRKDAPLSVVRARRKAANANSGNDAPGAADLPPLPPLTLPPSLVEEAVASAAPEAAEPEAAEAAARQQRHQQRAPAEARHEQRCA